MDIDRNKEITVTFTEEEYCSIIYAIGRLNHEAKNINVGNTYRKDALFETAVGMENELMDALDSPFL